VVAPHQRTTGFVGNQLKFAVCLLFGVSVAAQTGTPAAAASSPQQGLRDAGRDLFTGTVHFKNGGPACVACHDVAGLGFPGGGNMGPDLTGAYAKLGPDGLNSALETLYFPAMTPLFAYRPLTPDERRNLAAYFQGVNGRQSGTPTPAIGAIALVGLLLLVAATGIAGRRRVRSVRKALFERVRLQAGIQS
jgi:mono/diheme cytochrome c family protein